jgi:hypothetical protein
MSDARMQMQPLVYYYGSMTTNKQWKYTAMHMGSHNNSVIQQNHNTQTCEWSRPAVHSYRIILWKSSWLETTVCNITTHQHLPYILHSLSDDIPAYETSLFFIIYWTLLQDYMWQMWIIVQLSTLFLSFHKGVSSTLTEHSLPTLLQYNIQSS